MSKLSPRYCLFALLLVVSVPSFAEQAKPAETANQQSGTAQGEKPADGDIERLRRERTRIAGNDEKSAEPKQKDSGKQYPEWLQKLFNELKITDILLTIFTAALAISTHRLWLSTEKLWKAGERQIEVAQKTADAALKSSDLAEKSFVETNRPIIEIVVTDIDFTGEHHEGKPTFSFDLTNLGGTVGYIENSHFGISVQDTPVKRHFEYPIGDWVPLFSGDVAVSPRGGFKFSIAYQGTLTDEQNQARMERRLQTYVHGFIYYRSPTGARWRREFVRFCQPPMRGNPAYVEAVLDPGFNFDRRVDTPDDKHAE